MTLMMMMMMLGGSWTKHMKSRMLTEGKRKRVFSSGLVARELQKTRVEKNKIIRFVDIINWQRSEVAVGIRTERC